MLTPNEKYIELLFTSYVLRQLPMDKVSVFAPSSREEFLSGYDAKFMGHNGCRELYLQFKRARQRKKDGRFTIQTTPHQHKILRAYHPLTAYYVAPIFENIADMQSRLNTIKHPDEFLDCFIAIDASTLDDDTDYMQYGHQKNNWLPADAYHKREIDGAVKIATHPIDYPTWLPGSELFKGFKEGVIGSQVRFRQGDEPMSMSRTERQMADILQLYAGDVGEIFVLTDGVFNRLLKTVENKPSSYGIMLRLWDV